MKKKETSRIQSAEMKFLGSMLGKTRRDRIRNVEIRRTLDMTSMEQQMIERRLRWYVKRMDRERIPGKMYEMEMAGRRPKGRPRHRYRDTIKNDVHRKVGNWELGRKRGPREIQ
uniref:Uncharacterized protein n=1 Tax=Cacopsylla melanoneura TaxID=428564 RepID=A0A8D8QLG8_9HEMI